jgi:hypothetical protein
VEELVELVEELVELVEELVELVEELVELVEELIELVDAVAVPVPLICSASAWNASKVCPTVWALTENTIPDPQWPF